MIPFLMLRLRFFDAMARAMMCVTKVNWKRRKFLQSMANRKTVFKKRLMKILAKVTHRRGQRGVGKRTKLLRSAASGRSVRLGSPLDNRAKTS